MAVIKANVTLCQGYANCVDAAPDVFDLDDDGVVDVLRPHVDDEERSSVDEAVRSCPVKALTVDNS